MPNLKDKLSHLAFRQACKLLGPTGEMLIRKGGAWDIDILDQVKLNHALFRLDLDEAVVSISLDPARNQRLRVACSACDSFCEHMGPRFPSY
jgi:hypothetical protein